MKAPLVVLVDTREQRPLAFPPDVEVRSATINAGDYTAAGVEQYARIERKSSADLWGTVHQGHDRFNRELSRLGDFPRAGIVVDDAPSAVAAARAVGLSDEKKILSYLDLLAELMWTGRVPMYFGGDRAGAARRVVMLLRSAVEDYSPERLARCEEIARIAGPYSSGAELRAAALASLFGICVDCGRRPGTRPKPPGPGICVCGRVRKGQL